jgi:hypothetical protein
MRTRRFALGLGVGLVLAVTIGCGKDESGVGAYQRELQAKENATTSIQGVGGKMVEKSYPQVPNAKAWAIDLSGKQLSPAILTEMASLGHISELNLSKTNLTDEDMKKVAGLVGFCLNLDLSHTQISDTGLAELKNMLVLKDLNLTDTKCTSAGVEELKKRQAANPNARFKTPSVKLK